MTPILAVGVFEFLIATVLIVVSAITLVALAGIVRSGSSSRSGRESNAKEARLIQEMHQSLSKLENRIDSLETIIIESERVSKETETESL